MGLEDRRGRSPHAASTAEGAAASRAVGARFRDPAVRNPDYLATRFIGGRPNLTSLLNRPVLWRLGYRLFERIVPGVVAFDAVRTRWMDAVLRGELEAGARQVVVLGAGFDSRAFRFAHLLGDTAWFEVDHPLTQAVKRARVEKVFGAAPDHLRFVEVDFTRDDLAARLAAAGFEGTRRACVVWSGVAPYLPDEAIDAVLTWVASLAPESAVVFDYPYREMVDGDDSSYGAAKLRARVAKMGEPLLFGIPEGRAAAFLAERGLELAAELDPDEGRRRFLTSSDGVEHLRSYECGGIVVARVPDGDVSRVS